MRKRKKTKPRIITPATIKNRLGQLMTERFGIRSAALRARLQPNESLVHAANLRVLARSDTHLAECLDVLWDCGDLDSMIAFNDQEFKKGTIHDVALTHQKLKAFRKNHERAAETPFVYEEPKYRVNKRGIDATLASEPRPKVFNSVRRLRCRATDAFIPGVLNWPRSYLFTDDALVAFGLKDPDVEKDATTA